MTFTDFVCLFLVVRGRAPGRTGRQAVAGREAGGRQTAVGGEVRQTAVARRAETGQRSPRAITKNAVGRRECTGPQPFGQNTSLNPNSAQLSSSSRPNHT